MINVQGIGQARGASQSFTDRGMGEVLLHVLLLLGCPAYWAHSRESGHTRSEDGTIGAPVPRRSSLDIQAKNTLSLALTSAPATISERR